MFDKDTRQLPQWKRRELLSMAFPDPTTRVSLVRSKSVGFRAFFDEVDKAGGEGLVLKKFVRPYRAHTSDGKTEDWIRCKRFRYVDYVVMEIGKSDGGSPNLQVGLVVNGRLQRVATIKNLPEGLDYRSLVGRVVECKGAEVHESGALRHGHYERTRDDKEPTDCTLEAALES
jgi:ATP-dependent DNA ligase